MNPKVSEHAGEADYAPSGELLFRGQMLNRNSQHMFGEDTLILDPHIITTHTASTRAFDTSTVDTCDP